jgi:hypothetical protein
MSGSIANSQILSTADLSALTSRADSVCDFPFPRVSRALDLASGRRLASGPDDSWKGATRNLDSGIMSADGRCADRGSLRAKTLAF